MYRVTKHRSIADVVNSIKSSTKMDIKRLSLKKQKSHESRMTPNEKEGYFNEYKCLQILSRSQSFFFF